jgi:hypothetical protein
LAGTWRIPVTRRIRTANLDAFEMIAAELNDQVTAPRLLRHHDMETGSALPHAHLHRLRLTAAIGDLCEGEDSASDDAEDRLHADIASVEGSDGSS